MLRRTRAVFFDFTKTRAQSRRQGQTIPDVLRSEIGVRAATDGSPSSRDALSDLAKLNCDGIVDTGTQSGTWLRQNVQFRRAIGSVWTV